MIDEGAGGAILRPFSCLKKNVGSRGDAEKKRGLPRMRLSS